MAMTILQFSHHGSTGTISIDCVPNDDPAALGCRPGALGLPACTASVTFPAHGYRAMFGWIQLVNSTDNASAGAAFEMDPLSLFSDVDSPYAFFGHLPTLFDGPSRQKRDDMDWLAHSFLATTHVDSKRRVLPLAGFSWGFEIRGSKVALRPVAALASVDWRTHLPVLEKAHPNWHFAPEGWPSD
jgi:hypothetical protein